jgi:hypothetical protein
MTMTPAAERLRKTLRMGGRSNASGEEERMHNQSEQSGNRQPPLGGQPTLGAAGSDDQAAQRSPQSQRQPSKIERRDWHGSGVCGDRHTD